MPKSIRMATLDEVRHLEHRTNANVRIGSYNMDCFCPIYEMQFVHMELTWADLSRMFLLWEPTFIQHTKFQSCKLDEITSSAESMAMQRRSPGDVNMIDLTMSAGLEPVLVTDSLEHGPLVAIDGNHRLTAHYARRATIDGVKVYVGIHDNMLEWQFVPPLARCKKKMINRSGGSAAS